MQGLETAHLGRSAGGLVVPAAGADISSRAVCTTDLQKEHAVGTHSKPSPDPSTGTPPPGNTDGKVPPPPPPTGTRGK
ncbi:hypothetical protein GCM10010371_67460 [Streptomyces subrutilus]|uniref:Uncharacterized protein n=1 Tax=Streptomyces subrutilus TaxID=36818 RepID=A0A5P2UXT5_9ACTN|nr:hypothetical protein CP968_32070 [Streptomyces subrutilus]GGZ98218.1 hypothetical protein GCM10010371_67460 [Streptomyces subrutilus]